jgi:hypothetical protein
VSRRIAFKDAAFEARIIKSPDLRGHEGVCDAVGAARGGRMQCNRAQLYVNMNRDFACVSYLTERGTGHDNLFGYGDFPRAPARPPVSQADVRSKPALAFGLQSRDTAWIFMFEPLAYTVWDRPTGDIGPGVDRPDRSFSRRSRRRLRITLVATSIWNAPTV